MNHTSEAAHPPDWGIPDWLDANAYPDYRTASMVTWCWEFLRRNQAYREFWEKTILSAQQAVDPLDRGQTLDWPHRPGIFDGGHLVGTAEANKRFGLWRAYNPRQAQCGAQFDSGSTSYWMGPYNLEIDLSKREIAIKFDLSIPLEPQVERSKLLLASKQKFLVHIGEDITEEIRPHVEKFASYLRVLDAKEVGVSNNKQIAAVLFSKLDQESGVENVHNHYKKAKWMRDTGYRIYAVAARK